MSTASTSDPASAGSPFSRPLMAGLCCPFAACDDAPTMLRAITSTSLAAAGAAWEELKNARRATFPEIWTQETQGHARVGRDGFSRKAGCTGARRCTRCARAAQHGMECEGRARSARAAHAGCVRDARAHRGARGPRKCWHTPEALDERLADAALALGNHAERLGAARLLADHRGVVDLCDHVADLKPRLGELGAALPARPAEAQLYDLDARKHLAQPHAVLLGAAAVVSAADAPAAARAVARHHRLCPGAARAAWPTREVTLTPPAGACPGSPWTSSALKPSFEKGEWLVSGCVRGS